MRRIQFSVASGDVLLEAAKHFNAHGTHSSGMVEGLEMIRAGLARVAKRSIELGDSVLLEEMQHLGCIRKTS